MDDDDQPRRDDAGDDEEAYQWRKGDGEEKHVTSGCQDDRVEEEGKVSAQGVSMRNEDDEEDEKELSVAPVYRGDEDSVSAPVKSMYEEDDGGDAATTMMKQDEEVDMNPLPFTRQTSILEEIDQWRRETDTAIAQKDVSAIRLLVRGRRLPGLDEVDRWDVSLYDVESDELEWDRLSRASSSSSSNGDDEEEDDDDDDLGNNVFNRMNPRSTPKVLWRQGRNLARLMYRGGLVSVLASSLDVCLAVNGIDGAATVLDTLQLVVAENNGRERGVLGTRLSRKAFKRTWTVMQLQDAQRMILLCAARLPSRASSSSSSGPGIPTDVLRNIKSFLFAWESDLLKILARDGLLHRLGLVLQSPLVSQSEDLRMNVLDLVYDLGHSSRRVEIVRTPSLFHSLVGLIQPGHSRRARSTVGGLLTNLTDREDSAEASVEMSSVLVDALLDLMIDRDLLTVQTITNLSNFSKTREMMLKNHPDLIETLLAFHPTSDAADLFRLMCVSNLHVDASFSNRNRFGRDTSRLRVPADKSLTLFQILRLLMRGLEGSNGISFRRDELLLSLMALLWDVGNRRMLAHTNVVTCLVEALLASIASKDGLGFRLSLSCLETICRVIVVGRGGGDDYGHQDSSEGDEDQVCERYHTRMMEMLYFVQRALAASNPRDSAYLFAKLSASEAHELEAQVGRVLTYCEALERRSTQQMDAVD